ncbi:MAG: glycosyltransferase family 4 protein [Gemmatimonadaceae bacterium]|nr:glycosyltransferase family 4 protein [Gemmatimonadaceae bacterium]
MSSLPLARHIGIEATRLLRERRGIGRYVRNMLRWIPVHRPDVRFTLFVKREADIAPLHAQLADFDASLPDRTSIEPVSALRRTSADVVWYAWNWLNPPTRDTAMVATICDVAQMLQFDHRWWKVLKRRKARRRLSSTIRQADLIITISEFTAQEIQQRLHANSARIRVTLLATDDMTASAIGESEALPRLGVEGPFFLTVGAHDARKNLVTLYRAMELLQARGERVPLVQCGPSDDHEPYPFIKYAGYVSDAELATLYRKATALVFPSRYEGFGLPVAEAMAAGGRVVCADASSLPEVVGSAGLLFPWNDAEALAAQLTRLLHDEALRDRLTHDGLAQSAKFRWTDTAQQTLAVFDEAVSLHRQR